MTEWVRQRGSLTEMTMSGIGFQDKHRQKFQC